jgi:alpha-tubulin suppressor-like RCC1 family protein
MFGTGFNGLGQLGLGNLTNTNRLSVIPGKWSSTPVCGGSYTMAQSAGTYKWYGAGDNTYSQFGISTNSNYQVFTAIPNNWMQMSCGQYHTVALSARLTFPYVSRWYVTGLNSSGQLGLGDNNNRAVFTALTGDWVQISCGGYHTMALSADSVFTRKLFAAGDNTYGQLGLGDNVNRNEFTQLTGNWDYVYCGPQYTMALSSGTNIWFATGVNNLNQLVVGGGGNKNTFTQIAGTWDNLIVGFGNHSLASNESFSPTATPTITPTPTITRTPTPTPTLSGPTATPTPTPTITSTPTVTPTPTLTPNVNVLYAASYVPLEVTNAGLSYNISQIGTGNPALTCFRGTNYDFIVLSPSHPFALRLASNSTSPVSGTYNNNPATGISSDRVLFTPTSATPNSIIYQCAIHSSMSGVIAIKDYL